MESWLNTQWWVITHVEVWLNMYDVQMYTICPSMRQWQLSHTTSRRRCCGLKRKDFCPSTKPTLFSYIGSKSFIAKNVACHEYLYSIMLAFANGPSLCKQIDTTLHALYDVNGFWWSIEYWIYKWVLWSMSILE